ncbi:MAG: diguanylate cyclase [Burkholderiales bacterium]|nr:diguanylate cyclase [Burkholderiales bacterium]
MAEGNANTNWPGAPVPEAPYGLGLCNPCGHCSVPICADCEHHARIEAENALRESEERFRSIANATPVMIWLSGLDTLCHWFNAGWLAFTGRTLAQEQGNGWTEGVHPDDFQRCVDVYLRSFELRQPFQMEYRLKHHSGEHRWVHDSGTPRFDAAGEFLGYIGSCVDAHEIRTVRNQLAAMADAIPGVVCQWTSDEAQCQRFVYISRGLEDLYGFSVADAMRDGGALTQGILPQDQGAFRVSVAQASREQVRWQHAYRIRTPAGVVKWVQGQAAPQRQPDGSVLWSGLLTDISVQKALEDQLRLSASVFENVQEGVVITDVHHHIIDVNAAFCRMSGYTRSEVIGLNPRFLKSGIQPDTFYRNLWEEVGRCGFWTGEIFNRAKGGDIYAAMLNINAVKDANGVVSHYVGVSTDINQLKSQQQMLERVAHYDALTLLPNRTLLADRLRQSIGLAQRQQTLLGVCYLDLDGFKHVNDTQGHGAGDLVLQVVGQRLVSFLRASDTAARLGGDEFIVLLGGLASAEVIPPLLQRLLQAIGEPICIPGVEAVVGASIGVALYPTHATEPDTLLRQADMAMYAAKAAGKNRYHLSAVGQAGGG